MFAYGVMPPLMFGAMIVFLLIGYPAAFSLAAVGLFFGVLGVFTGHFSEAFLQALPIRIFGIISNELLLAIPFFTFMGAILERCGLAEDLLKGTGQLFGRVPGGLAYAVILVGAILGAITGTVAASVIAMGVISLPIMLRYGYSRRLATGVIAASGTITQLIPPSLVLIVLADQLGRSVGDMYAGAIGPSLLQVAVFILYVAGLSLVRPDMMPPLPEEARTERGWTLIIRVLKGMIPSIALIFLVLGTIMLGLASPTEAGAMGVVGSDGACRSAPAADLAAHPPGDGLHHAHHRHGHLHPDRLDLLHACLPGNGRSPLDRAPPYRPAWRSGRLSDLRERLRLLPRLLPRFLRDRVHRRPAAGAGGRRLSASISSGSACSCA